ncbi:MAG: hypothetical protein IE931_14645 [Sphingobacteriales bacterium]|nr:hypothetical protein [Sphingobacteriales bacterium]
MKWSYSREPTKEDYGFIYQIDYSDGTSYIGKKNLWIKKELLPLKSRKKRQNAIGTIVRNYKNKRVTMEIVLTPSNWKNYTGSSKLTKNKIIVAKTILAYAPTKRYLTYLETKAILCLGALEDDKFLNENCLGKFFKGNLI